MDNKLSELSKPVAWMDIAEFRKLESGEQAQTLKYKRGSSNKPFYSQEYVSALDGVAQFWIGESAGWKQRAEAAEQRIAELEAKLARREAASVQPYGYLRENDGQIQISIGPERPHDRSGGYATPWAAIYARPGINDAAATDAPADLVMQVRRLLHALKAAKPDSVLIAQVAEFMTRKGYFKATDCLR